jgi:hypothetical protein
VYLYPQIGCVCTPFSIFLQIKVINRVVKFLKVLFGNMGVNFCSLAAIMTHPFLNITQVCPLLQMMCCKLCRKICGVIVIKIPDFFPADLNTLLTLASDYCVRLNPYKTPTNPLVFRIIISLTILPYRHNAYKIQ